MRLRSVITISPAKLHQARENRKRRHCCHVFLIHTVAHNTSPFLVVSVLMGILLPQAGEYRVAKNGKRTELFSWNLLLERNHFLYHTNIAFQ